MSAATKATVVRTSLTERLADTGIVLRHHRPGQHRAPCPCCDRGPHDDALAVRIDDRGATWICHRCGWIGGAVEGYRTELASTPRPIRWAQPDHEHETLSSWGRDLWSAGKPVTPETVAGKFLLRRRCTLPQPHAVRFVEALKYGPTGASFPALISLVTDVRDADKPLNLHRTWLAADGSTKALVEKPRLLLKGHRKAGGVIRLCSDDHVEQGLGIAEGVETGLAAMHVFRPIWSLIDAGGIQGFQPLAGIEALTIFADNDLPQPGRTEGRGEEAATVCAVNWTAAGKKVRVILADRVGEDFNDMVQGMTHG